MTRLSRNIIYNFFGQGILLVLGFVSVKFIFRQLGEDALGIIYFSAMLNSVLCIVLEMGICTTTVREVSAYHRTDPDYIRELVRTGSLLYWVAYVVIAVSIYYLAPVIVGKWINLKTMDPDTATKILRILGISSIVALPKSFYVSLIRGLQRMEFNNAIDVITSALQQFGTILILAMGGDLFLVVYWFAACYGLRILIYLIVSSYFFSFQAIIPGYSNRVIKKNLLFASRMIFISITGAIHTHADKLILSKLMNIGVVGYYGFVYGGISRGRLLTSAISQATYPSFSALFREGDRSKLISQYRKIQDLLCFATVPIFAFVPFCILPLLTYVFNEKTAQLLFVPTILLSVGFYMNATLTIPYILSIAVGKPGIAARQHLYDLFATLPATALLIYYFDLIGASLSFIFLNLFHFFYAMRRTCSECLEMSTWTWCFHVLRIVFLVAVTYGLAWLILEIIGNHSIPCLASSYIVSSVGFLAGSYFLITEDLRTSLFQYFQSRKSRLKLGEIP